MEAKTYDYMIIATTWQRHCQGLAALTCMQDAQRVQVVHAGCNVNEAAADHRLCANKLRCQAFSCGSANALMCGSR